MRWIVAMAGVLAMLIVSVSSAAKDKTETEPKPKADPTGTWKWTADPDGLALERSVMLRLEKGNLSGKYVSSPGRRGKEIKEALFKDGTVTFSLPVVAGPGITFRSIYTGKVVGDTIKGKMTIITDLEDGTSSTGVLEWVAKRVKK